MAAASSVSGNPLDNAFTESSNGTVQSIEINPEALDSDTYYFFLIHKSVLDRMQAICFRKLKENGNINRSKDEDCYTLERRKKNIITCVSITNEKEAALEMINSILKEAGYTFKPKKINQNREIPGTIFTFQISIPEASNVFYARSFYK